MTFPIGFQRALPMSLIGGIVVHLMIPADFDGPIEIEDLTGTRSLPNLALEPMPYSLGSFLASASPLSVFKPVAPRPSAPGNP
jgi:hypothetical protein